MSYHYTREEINELIEAGILLDPNDHSLIGIEKEIELIERNTKCPMCSGPVKVIKWNEKGGIICKKCNHTIS